MRKIIIGSLLTLLLMSGNIYATHFGIGGYGGINIPIVQEDQSTGSTFGLKGKFGLLNGIAVEPNMNFSKFGEAQFDFGTRPGSKMTSFGIDILLGGGMGGGGFRMYGILGLGLHSIRRDYDEDQTKFGWTVGTGFEIGLAPYVALDLRGKANVVESQGGGTKKSAMVVGGINYYFGY
jgi:opacity protein-like surface antigen